jgi:alcohol dehydrogenase class IV
MFLAPGADSLESMMSSGLMFFEFATARRILFGRGRVKDAASAAASLGRRALLVTGNNPKRTDFLVHDLKEQDVSCRLISISGEPTIPRVEEGVKAAKEAQCDFCIAFGGGSVLDAGKAIAALMTNPGPVTQYLEVVGNDRPLANPGAPCICIPTTAGTGSEVTRNAVLVSPEHRVKVSLRSPDMLPTLAVVDPELTFSLPPSITASTGLDALTQLIEPFVCNAKNSLTDAICREGIRRASLWLPLACSEGQNAQARENMALASLFGGLALANARLGAIHGLAATLGGMFPIPHGVICARLLPIVMHANLRILRSQSRSSTELIAYEEVAQLLTRRPSAEAEEGVDWVRQLCSELSVPHFSSYGVTEKDLPAAAAQARKSSSIRGNPVPLTVEELTEILKEAL